MASDAKALADMITDIREGLHNTKVQYVPDTHPYGSITDGSYYCGRCGEDRTGCALCAGMPVDLKRNQRFYSRDV